MICLKCRKTVQQDIYGLHIACYRDWFNLSDVSKFSNSKKQDSARSLPNIRKTPNTFYHGQYLKYSAQLGEIKYILKIQQEKCPDMPGMEYTCNQIASLLQLKVPEYYLIKFQGGSDNERIKNSKDGLITFATKNFMQNRIGTLNHIYKFLPKGKQNHNCKQLIQIIHEQTQELDEVQKFIEICLFDTFIGNNDRHGRNLGIIDTGKSKTLAPMYDNPSYLGITEDEILDAQFNISGCIQTSTSKNPKVKDYLKEFAELGFETVCADFIQKLIAVFPAVMEEVESSEISKRRKKAFIKFLNSRIRDFQND